MALMACSGPSQEPGTLSRSPTWVAGTQTREPSSAIFPRSRKRAEWEVEQPELDLVLIGDASFTGSHLIHCSTVLTLAQVASASALPSTQPLCKERLLYVVLVSLLKANVKYNENTLCKPNYFVSDSNQHCLILIMCTFYPLNTW